LGFWSAARVEGWRLPAWWAGSLLLALFLMGPGTGYVMDATAAALVL
jgi:hypothetical protein